jgi:hypothetical protein
MKIIIYTALVLLFIQAQAFSQDTGGYGSVQLTSFANGSAVIGLDGNSTVSTLDRIRTSRNLEGTPFYNEDWKPGIVLINNDLKSGEVMLKYNPYQNLVFFKEKKAENVLALNNEFVTGFILNKDSGKAFFKNGFNAKDNDINRYTFFRVLHDGSVKLLVHHRTYVRKSQTNAFASGTISNEFRHKEDYYIQPAEGKNLQEISLKKKDLFDHIDEKYHNQLENYADKNDLDFDEEKGMSNILGYYEQLITKADK